MGSQRKLLESFISYTNSPFPLFKTEKTHILSDYRNTKQATMSLNRIKTRLNFINEDSVEKSETRNRAILRVLELTLNQHPWIELKADAVLILGFDSATIQNSESNYQFTKQETKKDESFCSEQEEISFSQCDLRLKVNYGSEIKYP